MADGVDSGSGGSRQSHYRYTAIGGDILKMIPVTRAKSSAFRTMLVDYWRDLVPEADFLGDAVLAEAEYRDRYRWSGESLNPFWAMIDERIVGFLMFRLHDDGRGAYLHDFYIVPEHRRQGYGTALFRTLRMHLAGLGIEEIEMQVLVDRPDSLAFWRDQGLRLQAYRLVGPVANSET
jgi:ribosomal protein S18 acetylase RimI-like enzyme